MSYKIYVRNMFFGFLLAVVPILLVFIFYYSISVTQLSIQQMSTGPYFILLIFLVIVGFIGVILSLPFTYFAGKYPKMTKYIAISVFVAYSILAVYQLITGRICC